MCSCGPKYILGLEGIFGIHDAVCPIFLWQVFFMLSAVFRFGLRGTLSKVNAMLSRTSSRVVRLFNFVLMGQKTASHGYLFDRGVRYFEYRSAFFLFSKEKGCFWFSPLPIHARPRQFTVESVASSVVMATFDCRRKVRKKLPCFCWKRFQGNFSI